jgi:hypothetical protein
LVILYPLQIGCPQEYATRNTPRVIIQVQIKIST